MAGQRQCGHGLGIASWIDDGDTALPEKRLRRVHADTHADIDERGRRSLEGIEDKASGVGSVDAGEHVVEVTKETGVVRSDHFRVRDDVPVHGLVDASQIPDFGRRRTKRLERYRTWIAKRVVLLEDIAIPEIDLADGRFRHEVEHIGTGAAQANNRDVLRLQAVGGYANVGSRRRGVFVCEHGLVAVGQDERKRTCTDAWRNVLGMPFELRHVLGDLLIVGLIEVVSRPRFCGEIVVHGDVVHHRGRAVVDDGGQGMSLRIAGTFADEIGRVLLGLDGDVAGQVQAEGKRSALHTAIRVDVRHVVDEQVASPRDEMKALIPQAQQIRTTNDQ